MSSTGMIEKGSSNCTPSSSIPKRKMPTRQATGRNRRTENLLILYKMAQYVASPSETLWHWLGTVD